MSEPLDPEVAGALARVGLCIRAFRRISKIGSADAGRSTYRIDVETGHTIKARRVDDDETARRLFEVRRELPEAFAPVIGCYGAVLLEEWIDGEELGKGIPSDAHLTTAASLLAHLHATQAVAGHPVHERRSTAVWRETAEESLRQVLAADALDVTAVTRIREALEQRDPGQASVGLVHTDFCGENMVEDRAGRLRVIDNERVGVDAIGFDVARTWYRWALPVRAWECFRSAYAARVSLTEPLDTLGFWSVVAVAHSAALRLRKDRRRAHVPLDRLRRMAVECDLPQTPGPCPGDDAHR
jgi:thiamine kinase-like enzyme